MNFSDFDPAVLPREEKGFLSLWVAPRSAAGDWEVPLLYACGERRDPPLVVVAGVHGDEYEGVAAIGRVYQDIDPRALKGTLLGVPVCNVPAYEAGTRASPVDGLNMARVLPGVRDGSLTQRIGYWITEKLMMGADLFIDLHSGGVSYNFATSIQYHHGDGPLAERGRAAAEAFGAPVTIGHPDPGRAAQGCSFRTAFERGVAGIFTEGPGGGRVREEDAACYARGVLNVMKHLGMTEGQADLRRRRHHLLKDDQGGLDYPARASGFFQPDVELLAPVREGQRLGRTLALDGATREEIAATRSGVVVMLHAVPCVNVGDALVEMAIPLPAS